jgi:hypothetical protein
MFPIDVLRFSEFRTMRNYLSETLMLIDIQITKKFHHISKINLFPLSPIAKLTALAVKFSTTKKHCKILT